MNKYSKETTSHTVKLDAITDFKHVRTIADTLAQIGIERRNQRDSQAIEETQKAERARKCQQENEKLDGEVREWKQRTEDERRAREKRFDETEPSKNSTLDELDIQFNKFRNGNTLRLSGQQIKDDKVPSICKYLARHPDITALDLSNNKILGGAILLAANQTLTSLDLSQNLIYGEAATALADNRILTSLNLARNYIGDQGATDLAGNQTLISLNLDYNMIVDKGVAALANNKTLSNLSLKGNHYGNRGLVTLLDNQTLTSLNLIDADDKIPSSNSLKINGYDYKAVNELLVQNKSSIQQEVPARNRKLQEAYRETLKNDLLTLLRVKDLVLLIQGYIPKFFKINFSPVDCFADQEKKMTPLRPALKSMPGSNASTLFMAPLTSIRVNLVNDQKKLLRVCEISNPKKCTQFMSFFALVNAPLLCRVSPENAEYDLNLDILRKIQIANPGATGEVAALLGIQEQELRQFTGNEANFSIT